MMGVTRERVRQIENRAIKKLQIHKDTLSRLRDFLQAIDFSIVSNVQ